MMNYCILSEEGIITNIIICSDDETAAIFGALPSYNGAMIGDTYLPPEPEPPAPTEIEQLQAQVSDLQNQILTMRLGGL